MSITQDQVKEVAELARLRLDGSEVERLASELASILDHMRELEAVDVAGAPPMGGVSEHDAPMREDSPGPDPLCRPISDFAPAWEEHLFLVPRLAALDGDASPVQEGGS